MAHERQEIRDAVVAQLMGETAAETRVLSSRRAPVQMEQLPAIGVYTIVETIDPASKKSTPRELKRIVTVAIQAWVMALSVSALADALDDIALEIETAMDSSVSLDGYAFDSVGPETEIGIELDGAKPIGCVTLTYEATYHTGLRVTEPEDIFDSVDLHTSLNGEQDDEDDQANDLILEINQE